MANPNDANDGKVPVLCECESFDCSLIVMIDEKDVENVLRPGLVVIVDGCEIGPNPSDVLLEKHDGYSLYLENMLWMPPL